MCDRGFVVKGACKVLYFRSLVPSVGFCSDVFNDGEIRSYDACEGARALDERVRMALLSLLRLILSIGIVWTS